MLGTGVAAIDLPRALDEIEGWLRDGHRAYVCVTGVHGVMESRDDPAVRQAHDEAGLVVPDGMPLVWAARRAGAADVSRVYGPDLMLALSERAAEAGWTNFYFGAAPGTPERLASRLTARFPGLRVAGVHSPPFRPPTADEDDEMVRMINDAAPDIVWVGLSTPKQERWMAEHRDRLDAPVLIGVGAAFDIHAGNVAQAPRWMQETGLEWVYRLCKEPRRLWRRYFRNNPRFVLALLRDPPRLQDS